MRNLGTIPNQPRVLIAQLEAALAPAKTGIEWIFVLFVDVVQAITLSVRSTVMVKRCAAIWAARFLRHLV